MRYHEFNLTPELDEDRLSELTGIKQQVQRLPQDPKPAAVVDSHGMDTKPLPLGTDWHEVMIQHGFRSMGHGSFGTVWEHPRLPYVLKVFAARDRPYIDWIATARQHSDNPHIPRFISPRLVRINHNVVAVRMERLSPPDSIASRLMWVTDDIVTFSKLENCTPRQLIKKHGLDTFDTVFASYIQTHPKFLDAITIISEFIATTGHYPDLHDKNIMLRGDVAVFTDPVYDPEEM